jgi:hypothetical protein
LSPTQNEKNAIKRKQTKKQVDKPAAIGINGSCIVQGTLKIKSKISPDESLYGEISKQAVFLALARS